MQELEPVRPHTTFQVDLTEDQIASYRDNGFLSIERITTDEESRGD